MRQICGREEEIKLLNKLNDSKEPEFLAIYGRRRIGKTYLIDNFFCDKGLYFHFTGMKGASLKEHLRLFQDALNTRLETNQKTPRIKNWLEGFIYLKNKISSFDENQKIILFFDELPWIETKKSGFLKSLEHFWNDFLSKIPNVILIVCGSAASWMINKIIYNKGGLHNRLTAQIRLDPFSLKETEQFLKFKKIDLSRKQIVDLFMVTGGVAKYLTYVEKGLSSAQIIQKLCFQAHSPLIQEYPELFASLFDKHIKHKTIVEVLAKKRSGMTHTELLKATQKSSGGRFTEALEELKEAGFIDCIPSFNKKKKEGKFFLIDEYCFFYLTWIKNLSKLQIQGLDNNYWISMCGSAQHVVWSGFAFETLCRKNLKYIIKALNLEIVANSAVCWNYKPKNKDDESTQIDLIIDRKDNCMNLCEIKFYNQEVVITKEYSRKILFRKEKFKNATNTKKTLFNTLISVYGAKENSCFQDAFDNQIVLDSFFTEI